MVCLFCCCFSSDIPEEVDIGYKVMKLNVINQEVDKKVKCFFVQGNADGQYTT